MPSSLGNALIGYYQIQESIAERNGSSVTWHGYEHVQVSGNITFVSRLESVGVDLICGFDMCDPLNQKCSSKSLKGGPCKLLFLFFSI